MTNYSTVIYHYETIGNPPADQPLDMPWQIETQLVPTLKAIYAAEQLLYAGFTFPKLSMLFLYLRVFEARWSRIAAWVLIGITTACWIAFSLTAAFLCQPVSYYWDRLLPGGHCINIDTFWRAIPVGTGPCWPSSSHIKLTGTFSHSILLLILPPSFYPFRLFGNWRLQR